VNWLLASSSGGIAEARREIPHRTIGVWIATGQVILEAVEIKCAKDEAFSSVSSERHGAFDFALRHDKYFRKK
jgi:hypothetical protein